MMFMIRIVIAYLLGNISPSIIQGKLKGIDIRKEGSGNAGTTNTLRVLGKKAALITLVIDVCKGVLAVRLGSHSGPLCAMLCAVAVFAGHIWPAVWGFRGGKGVATAFGAVLAVNWKLALLSLTAVVLVTVCTKMMSAGSVCGAAALPVLSVFLERDFLPEALFIGAVILIKHRANIERILRGEESKLNFTKR